MSLISFDDVSFKYSGKSAFVLENLSFELEGGHIYGLLGKNGVGKSTLFRLITGMNRITSGTLSTLDCDPSKRLPSMLSEIFILPEEIYFPDMDIGDYAKSYGSFYPNFSMSDLLGYMDELFQIDSKQKAHKEGKDSGDKDDKDKPYLKKSLKKMSQGQRKKACIAFALACHTKVLLMDEPTNGLDIPSKTVFRRLLSNYQTVDNLVVISTHQVRDLESLIDGVVIISEQHHLMLCTTANALLDAFHFGEIADPGRCIYHEEGIRNQNFGVSIRAENEPVQGIDELDLELLFNASMWEEGRIESILEEKSRGNRVD